MSFEGLFEVVNEFSFWDSFSDLLQCQSALVQPGFSAYITSDGVLWNICKPEEVVDAGEPLAKISLPWKGTGSELKKEVLTQTLNR